MFEEASAVLDASTNLSPATFSMAFSGLVFSAVRQSATVCWDWLLAVRQSATGCWDCQHSNCVAADEVQDVSNARTQNVQVVTHSFSNRGQPEACKVFTASACASVEVWLVMQPCCCILWLLVADRSGMSHRPAGTGGGLTAKDALGNDVRQSAWIKTHQPGDHSLVQGLKSDATYLIGMPSQPAHTLLGEPKASLLPFSNLW